MLNMASKMHRFPLQHNCYLAAFILPPETIRQRVLAAALFVAATHHESGRSPEPQWQHEAPSWIELFPVHRSSPLTCREA